MRLAIRRVAALTLLCLLTSVPTSASPFTYNESGSGDLPFAFPAPVRPFDAGINTINGQISFTVTEAPPAPAVQHPDFDGFAFSIPIGMQLTQIVLAFETTLVGSTVTSGGAVWALVPGNVAPISPLPLLVQQASALTGSGSISLMAGSLPAGPGTYSFGNNSMSFTGGQGLPERGFSTNYSLQFSVAPVVPEPTSVLLLGTGLIGAGVRRYRQRHSRA